MPALTRLLVRAALAWMGLGFTMGALLLAAKAGAAPPALWALRDPHIHVLLAGWMAQLAAGVAHWILPRHDASGDRGSLWPLAAAGLALNLAALAALAGAIAAARAMPAARALADLPVWLEAVAFVLAARHAWARTLPFRTLPRPGRTTLGERQ
jgi:hypothetical protein